MADQKSILVTGATGQKGGAVARELLAHGSKIPKPKKRSHSCGSSLLIIRKNSVLI
ncbi:MAG: hypothetical protein JRJ00_15155 [Deltaproteobacteria bacterium]|nr:hypothetical protein [Deltaproteobacteria bacterium]